MNVTIIVAGLNEAEDFILSGAYVVEPRQEASAGSNIAARGDGGTGTASGTFSGVSGTYWLDVSYFNERDGASPYTLAIAGAVVDSWSGVGGVGGAGTLTTRRVRVDLTDGDTIVLTGAKEAGEFARLDSLTLTPVDDDAAATATIALGVTEAEALDLTGDYAVEQRAEASGGLNIKSVGNGTASGTFDGADGDYTLTVSFFNERDGEAGYEILVNGAVVHTFTGTGGIGGAGELETRDFAVTLADGDTIALRGVRDAGEFARVDALILTERTDDPETPEPTDGTIVVGLNELEQLDLSGGYALEDRAEASGGANIRTTGTGEASGVFAGEDGAYWLEVAYFNERDGEARYALTIDGVEIDSWTGVGGSGGAGVIETRRIAVDLEEGSTIVLSGVRDEGEFARLDALTIDPRDGDGAEPGAALITAGLTEAEDLDLSGGYVVESGREDASARANIRTTSSGLASGEFDGADGAYDIDINYFNEFDGVAGYTLSVNGTVVDTWSGVGGSGGIGVLETRTVSDVALSDGDTITLSGTRADGEFARVDSLVLTESVDTPGLDPADFDHFAFLGQSNAERHFTRKPGDDSPGNLGSVVFADTIFSETGVRPEVLEAARGGSGSNPLADPSSFWWDLDRDRPGQPLLEAVRDIRAALDDGEDLDGIVWSQGEDDARAIASDFSNSTEIVDAMKAATLASFQYIWDRFGEDLPIFIQELGVFPEGEGTFLGDPAGAIDLVRAGQADLIAQDDRIFLGAETDGVDQFDTIHFSVAGYGTIAQDLAQTAVGVIAGDDLAIV